MKFESLSKPGKFYEVDVNKGTCTCPHYQNRMKYINGKCKHLMACINEITKIGDKELELLSFIKEHNKIGYFDLEKQFGDVEEVIQKLVRRGELLDERGILQVI